MKLDPARLVPVAAVNYGRVQVEPPARDPRASQAPPIRRVTVYCRNCGVGHVYRDPVNLLVHECEFCGTSTQVPGGVFQR